MDNENTPHEDKTHSSEESPELLEEIVEEILSRLPAKSLLRFRCVSKSWRSLIDSKRFIKTHLQNISENQNISRWRIIYCCIEHGLKQRSRQSYYDEPSLDPSPFDDPKNNHLTTAGAAIVGHCNGLLCILKQPGCFFLWNPTVRISIELPELDGVTIKSGFGWDEESGAYKVFAVLSDKEQAVGKVYSTKTNSWKTVDHGCLSLFDNKNSTTGKFTSGKIHWLTEGGLRIETFDLNSEAFGMMDHPFKPEVGAFMALCDDSTECLGVVSENYEKNTWKKWSMKKYGVKESWVEKILSVSYSMTFTCCHSVLFYKESLVSPVF